MVCPSQQYSKTYPNLNLTLFELGFNLQKALRRHENLAHTHTHTQYDEMDTFCKQSCNRCSYSC